MVQYQDQLDLALTALSDPTRRAILDHLGRGDSTITELAEPIGISLTGTKKHVRILEGAGLVLTEKVGRSRVCRLGPQDLGHVQRWVDNHRRAVAARLDRFGELLERTKGEQP